MIDQRIRVILEVNVLALPQSVWASGRESHNISLTAIEHKFKVLRCLLSCTFPIAHISKERKKRTPMKGRVYKGKAEIPNLHMLKVLCSTKRKGKGQETDTNAIV